MVQIRRAIILQLSGLLVFGLLLFFLSRLFPVVDILADVQQHVMRWGAWSAIWYPLLYACCNVLLLPGGVLSIGGGFFFAILILNREGINMGRSITAILFSSFLDGIFLAVMAPLVYFTVGKDVLFSGFNLQSVFGGGIFYSFWLIYYLIIAYKLLVGYALFVNPFFVKRLLLTVFSAPLIKHWRRGAAETGDRATLPARRQHGSGDRRARRPERLGCRTQQRHAGARGFDVCRHRYAR